MLPAGVDRRVCWREHRTIVSDKHHELLTTVIRIRVNGVLAIFRRYSVSHLSTSFEAHLRNQVNSPHVPGGNREQNVVKLFHGPCFAKASTITVAKSSNSILVEDGVSSATLDDQIDLEKRYRQSMARAMGSAFSIRGLEPGAPPCVGALSWRNSLQFFGSCIVLLRHWAV